MISSDTSCSQLVAGNYDVLVDEEEAEEEEEEEELENEKIIDNREQLEDETVNRIQLREPNNISSDISGPDSPVQLEIPTDEDLKSILGKFLTKFESYEEQLIEKDSNFYDSNYANEFKILKEFSRNLKENKANLEQGEKDFNHKKNRYKDIIPFEHTRVSLTNDPLNEPGSDYINANYIKGPSGNPKAYIACQGPLVCTLNDFWRMIWECQVSIIVMACNEFESGKPKCELYWPQEVETSEFYGNIQVTLVRVRQICADFLIRKFTIKLYEPEARPISGVEHMTTNSSQESQIANELKEFEDRERSPFKSEDTCRVNKGEEGNSSDSDSMKNRKLLAERTICQFHYVTWPDHGTPNSIRAILDLVRLIREVQPDDDKPILVHCSAGCGRTGTICCIDYVWGLLRRRKLNIRFSLFDIVNEMRQQRMSMVQTLEQYILCHRAVAALFLNHLKNLNFDILTQEQICSNNENNNISYDNKRSVKDSNCSESRERIGQQSDGLDNNHDHAEDDEEDDDSNPFNAFGTVFI